MSHRSSFAFTLLISLPWLPSCGGAPARPAAPVADAVELIAQPFPSRAALEAILAEPIPVFPASIDAVPVAEWTLKGPLPTTPLGAETDEGDWTKVARAFAETRGGALVLSPALRCTAREIASFFATKGGMPTESVQDFIAARCGWPYTLSSHGVLTATFKKAGTDAALLTAFKKHVDEGLASLVPNEPGTIGLAVERHEDRVVAVWVVGQPRAALSEPLTADASGVVHVRGKFLGAGDRARALMNGDGFSVHVCAAEPVAPPSFSFRCEGASTAGEPRWLTLVAHAPGQLIGRAVINTMVATSDASLTWHAPPAPSTAALGAPAAIGETILPPLNELRAALGEPPLRLAHEQAALNARLVPYVFSASTTNPARMEQISLGVLAGWDVKGGLVRDATLELLTSHATTAGDWLAEALTQPMGRLVLLDPRAEEIALGAYAVPGKSLVATVTSSYSFFHGETHPEIADALAARLLAERRAHGLPDVQRIAGLAGIDAATRDIAAGKDPNASLMGALQDATARVGRSFRGLALRTIDPTVTPLPPVLAASKVPTFAVAVGHHAAAGSAWGEYVILWLWPAE